LLGYENEDGELPIGPPSPWGPNGTFMVYREFDQHVDRFEEFIACSAKAQGIDEDAIRAKIVGRWDNGDPAVRPRPDLELQYRCPKCEAGPGRSCVDGGEDVRSHPERVEVAITLRGSRTRLNDFRYSEDPNGWGCPVGAHVRRTNPRDSLPGGGEQTMRHRIIRRGMPFQELDQGTVKREGLAFVCLGASIEEGFEFIQRNWINDGAAFGLGSAPDFLLHTSANRNEAKMVIPGFRPTVLSAPPQPFVTVRACEYLFVPSRVACAALAAFLWL
jgi:deferrochelatase/peroxidase EfeB